MRKDYSSDLTDSRWQKIEAVLDTSRHRQHDLRRDILDGLLYLLKTGCQWRMLPGGFAPWQTVYYYFRKWKKRGIIERLLSVARRSARQEAGREAEPSAVIIDCQSVPITRSGGLCGFDGNKAALTAIKRSKDANGTSSPTRRAGRGPSRFTPRTSTKASTRSAFSKKPMRKAKDSKPPLPTKPIEAISKTRPARGLGFGWKSPSRSRMSRAFRSNRSAGLSNAHLAGSEAGGGSRKSTNGW